MPHFEKMLYDQAQLACVYTDAYTLKKSPDLARVVRDILTYVNESLSDPSGGFYRYLIWNFFLRIEKKILELLFKCGGCGFVARTWVEEETRRSLLCLDL